MTVFFISLFLFILRLIKKHFKKEGALISIKSKEVETVKQEND
ncbi:hypothetical protein HNP21_004933 [Bacillus aryabhattai]|uniref:Uncharacterized protein n=1 Tax=Priestia aryabhattai TaxID=412384 RepID=A0A7W3NF71_PRIAR|nr:hypothetical protein [Priestia aryabhattai]